MTYQGPERRQPDELHLEVAERVREIHQFEYQQLHPEVQAILDAICGPVDPLTGHRHEAEGMKGQLARLENRQAAIAVKVDRYGQQRPRLKLTLAQATVLAAMVTGIFALLIILVQHNLGA